MITDKVLATLEFDKILVRLAEHTSFGAGREAALGLRPQTDWTVVRSALGQTSEARVLLEARPSTHLGGAHDIRAAVRRAEVGSVLTPTELMDVGTTLGASHRVRGAILKDDLEIPWLRRQAGRMAENRGMIQSLEETFTDRGDILDSASPALRRLRNDMNVAQGRLMDKLNSMVASAEHRTALQEPLVTMRNGRYVIPVRSEARSKIPGIVHDQSSSGQTVFVEPLAVTEMNNRLKELQLEEQREIERILLALSIRVAAQAPELAETVDALATVDVAFAKAKYASLTRSIAPRLNDRGMISLVDARHPLLAGNVVPISVSLGQEFRVLVITGPNTGGKTVALKTVGLLSLMAQAGLHVPSADDSELTVFDRVFADIGDEQSIEQSLSTFSSHMRNIVAMLPDIDGNSLVLLDELGAGTDPAEGAALARSLLNTLLASGARAVVTTHYSELKTFAHEVEGVENANVEFNVQTLSPTYRLMIGVPGRSQALAIAKRLGMPADIVSVAKQHIATGTVRVEKLLGQIQAERQEIGSLFRKAQELHADARKIRDRIRSELKTLQQERQDILSGAREDAAAAVRDLRQKLKQIENETRTVASRREQKDVQGRVDDIQASAARQLGPIPHLAVEPDPLLLPVRKGATVQILSLGQQGSVLRVSGGEAEVQLGQFKMRLPLDDLEVLNRKQIEPARAVHFESTRDAPPLEIDMRGWRADDALRELDQYLHDSFMHGQGRVRVVHGKGTGMLRRAIHEQLRDHALVKNFSTEKPELGGDGVTVVTLST